MRSRTLVVTIREERPGAVWIVEKGAGKRACVTPDKDSPTLIEVSVAGIPDSKMTSKAAPLAAKLLKSGACEASLDLFVPQITEFKYEVTVAGPGHRKFDPVRVREDGEPQRVTVVG
jgi:hypothetical protein